MKKFDKFLPKHVKSGQIKKIKALSYTNFGLLNKWFDHFLDARAEICKKISLFFCKIKMPKIHSDVIYLSFSVTFVYFMARLKQKKSVLCKLLCSKGP